MTLQAVNGPTHDGAVNKKQQAKQGSGAVAKGGRRCASKGGREAARPRGGMRGPGRQVMLWLACDTLG